LFFFFTLLSCSKSTSFLEKREEMVKRHVERRGITSPLILNAFRNIPREKFVLPQYQDRAYQDLELPIGEGQTLDLPYEDAVIIHALDLKPTDKVLEVGTGAGYLAALMGHIAKEVYTIEIRPGLANTARQRLQELGYQNVFVLTGDGYKGWPEHAPFDAIVLTASPDYVPEPLVEQLREGGRLVLPLGGEKKFQELVLYTKENRKLKLLKRLSGAQFVPMEGIIQEQEKK